MSAAPGARPIPRPFVWFVALGLYLTLRGYHSRDGDQAYRLPLLLDRQAASPYDADPFVRSFASFNPHRGYLALLDVASRPLGLSTALAGLFAATFFATAVGLDRLGRATWPGAPPAVGIVVVGLALLADAGNIGTNHLFEAMLLDRLVALALGWLAFAATIERPRQGSWLAPPLLGAAALIHPSLGLQLAALLGGGWLAWGVAGPRTGVSRGLAAVGSLLLGMALLPALGLMASQGSALFAGLPAEDYGLLAAHVQSPQHMLPHLWRMPQWLAWACYPALAILTLTSPSCRAWPETRRRLAVLLLVNGLGLLAGWWAIEVRHDLRATVFQPFRLATVFRGLCLIVIARRLVDLWRSGRPTALARAAILAAGLMGDWALVIATVTEFAAATARLWRASLWTEPAAVAAILGAGLTFLARHDTAAGHVSLLVAVAVVPVLAGLRHWDVGPFPRRRLLRIALAAWSVPALALGAAAWPGSGRIVDRLRAHCRFAETPIDDLERLAIWCREQTPPGSVFVGPPGPKTFRLWARRPLAFNRAGSPYHAAGLADWAARFRAHVAFEGTTAAFARAYLADRRALERRHDALSDDQIAALARSQGARYVLSSADREPSAGSPLERLRAEGRWAVFGLREPEPLASLARRASDPTRR